MRVYHQVTPDSLESALTNGLKRTSRGEKGYDAAVTITDVILDRDCPKELREQGVSRDNNLYAYMPTETGVIDITDGADVPLKEFVEKSDQATLELDIDPRECFVSDLDTFDALKEALANREPSLTIQKLSHSYWSKVVPLHDYTPGTFNRPEIMIPYDVGPEHIKKV